MFPDPLIMVEMAAVYNRMGDSEAALQLAGEARAAAESSGIREAIWRCHLQEGKALGAIGKPAQAEAALKNAISMIERIRLDVAGREEERETFFESRLEPYQRMLGLLAAAGRTGEAFQYAERAKARVVLEALKSSQAELPVVVTAEERQQERDLRLRVVSANTRLVNARVSEPATELAKFNVELDHARFDYEAFEVTLYANHPQLKLQRGATEPISLPEAERMMADSGSAFVEFVSTDDKLFVFAASGTASKVAITTLPITRKDLTDRVQRFREQLATRNMAFRSPATALYKQILAPVERVLAGARQLIVVPDGVLWELPFQALIDSAGRYLLDTCSVTYAPSLTALKAMTEVKRERRQSPGATELLAMGNPKLGESMDHIKAVYNDEQFGNLPNAEAEVRRLARIYGETKSHVYIGADARESRFKADAEMPRYSTWLPTAS
jgi:CHAT domain-containing protein